MNFHLVKYEMSCGLANQLPQSTLPEVVFAGRSNVGKSSLINKIFNQKQLARVSATPGKTATINFFRCGDVARFADLPGYGYAKVSDSERRRWSGLIEGYFHQDRDIRLVLSLLDIRHAPSADDLTMLDFLIDSELPFAVVLTKTDKLTNNQLRTRLEEIRTEIPCGDQVTLFPVSSMIVIIINRYAKVRKVRKVGRKERRYAKGKAHSQRYAKGQACVWHGQNRR